MTKDLYQGTWQEVMYKRMKAVKQLSEQIDDMISKIKDECDTAHLLNDLDEWFDAFSKKINIPTWNKLSEYSPDDLTIPVIGYVVTYKDDQNIHFDATWNSNEKIFFVWSDEEDRCVPLPNAHFWIPLVYPEIWSD